MEQQYISFLHYFKIKGISGEKNEENESTKNESQVYKSKYDINILPPQEKETLDSLSLVWLQGKMA